MKKIYKLHKRRGLRLKGFDYNQNGAYFITICTQNRAPYFKEGGLPSHCISPKSIAENIWQCIPVQFPFVKLSNFVVMPDHIHGIIVIKKDGEVGKIHEMNRMTTANDHTTTSNQAITNDQAITTCNEEPTCQKIGTSRQGGFAGHKNPMLHQNLSTIIRWYKGRCSFEIRKIIPGFAWQSLFYDHIIQNREALWRIQKYIIENPNKA